MKLVVTGGGTGGHVFPALEVAGQAKNSGWELFYLGSYRGQEKKLCEQKGIDFAGFHSYPFYGILTKRGFEARISFIKSTLEAQRFLKKYQPNILFSTGGYSSAPIVSAARRLKIPYVLHEQNSVPGRTNIILSKGAKCIATVFEGTADHFKNAIVVRTGMPVRAELREESKKYLSQKSSKINPHILVTGGSQGAEDLNESILEIACSLRKEKISWMHMTGPSHYEKVKNQSGKLNLGSNYENAPFLESMQLAKELACCSLSVCRSGSGTITELAAFQKPGIFIPYPYAHANHQFHNAKEIENLGAGTIIEQKFLRSENLLQVIQNWLNDSGKMQSAADVLAKWDIEDAARRVISLLKEASNV